MDNTQTVPEFTPEDIQANKTMAILAYFIFFLPLLAAKDSRFARYHSNQGLILLIFYVAAAILSSILTAIFVATFSLGILALLSILFTLIYLALAVLGILGIVNAAQGKAKPMPVIGGLFTIIK